MVYENDGVWDVVTMVYENDGVW